MILDREKINRMVMNQLDHQKENGLLKNFAITTQEQLDEINLDSKTKSALYELIIHSISASVQFSSNITMDIIDSIQNPENE